FVTLSLFANAQILDSIRFKNSKMDTVIYITQQDIREYIALRKLTDTVEKLQNFIKIVKGAKEFSTFGTRITYIQALEFMERSDKMREIYQTPITKEDIATYLSIRKINGDTAGKTSDYLKIIKDAKIKVASGQYMVGLYPAIDYETALKEAEENLRLRTMVDKILVMKSQRKMYLLKKGAVVKTYNIGLGPNPVGQKQREGDGRTPEGIYKLDYQKWNSPTFHSFHISYPNEQDLERAKLKGLTAGSNIMIHGTSKGVKKTKDWTNGCIAISNADMTEFKKMVFLETPVEIKK
ncbi:MAG: L,D-transpeptidase family protein, partial [Bacteroidia bacterium]